MASSTSRSIWYVYGIVPAEPVPPAMPSGLDGADVALEPHADAPVAALVSVLDDAAYSGPALEESSGDVEWLSPRAIAHDRVLTWASDRGPVVPLPMFSLFSGRDAVQRMLGERGPQLAETLDRLGAGREYALRVYRVDADFLESIVALSPRLRELAASAAAAPPGQRYLLERKLDAEKRADTRAVTQALVDEIMAALAPHALEQIRSPIPRAADRGKPAGGSMVLNAAFFVAPLTLEGFQRTLTSLVERHGSHGLRFDFTGPWPAYHFAGAAAGAHARDA